MEGPLPILGVAAAPPAPQARPETTPLNAATPVPIVVSPAVPWPRSAQWATAALIVLAVALLGWNVWIAQPWASRPSELAGNEGAFGRIDLNHADHAQLLQLPGVGEITAAHIEEYRQTHNGFQTVEDLRQVHGVGPALVERLRPLVFIDAQHENADNDLEVVPPRAALVPEVHKERPASRADMVQARKPIVAVKKTGGVAAPVDVNHASGAELQRLPGIGPALSGRILKVREQQPFQSVEELRRVPGIGVKTLDHLRPFVTVDDDALQPMP